MKVGENQYPYLEMINLGVILDGVDDLIDCFKCPSILILMSDDYESTLLILPDGSQKSFDDRYEAYDFVANYLTDLNILDLSSETVLGLITSAADEDEDGMYDIVEGQGGEILLSNTIYIENLIEEAEEIGLSNNNLKNMPFCLIQFTEDANLIVKNGVFYVDGLKVNDEEISSLPGYIDHFENKVCIYVR